MSVGSNSSINSHYSDIMGRFNDAIQASPSDMSQHSASNYSNSFSPHHHSHYNISNNMLAISSLMAKVSGGKTVEPQQDVLIDRTGNMRSAYSNLDTEQRKVDSQSDTTRFSMEDGDMLQTSLSSDSYKSWQSDRDTKRTYTDVPLVENPPNVLRTLRETLHSMTSKMESETYRESATRLEVRMAEILGAKNPWNDGQAPVEEDPSTTEMAGYDFSGIDDDMSHSLIATNHSAMDDVKQISRKVSQFGGVDKNYLEQINVMNSVLDAVKKEGTSVDVLHSACPVTTTSLYDSLNIEKLRLKTIQSLLDIPGLKKHEHVTSHRLPSTTSVSFDEIMAASSAPRFNRDAHEIAQLTGDISSLSDSSSHISRSPFPFQNIHQTSSQSSRPGGKSSGGEVRGSPSKKWSAPSQSVQRKKSSTTSLTRGRASQGDFKHLNMSQNKTPKPKQDQDVGAREKRMPGSKSGRASQGYNPHSYSMFDQWSYGQSKVFANNNENHQKLDKKEIPSYIDYSHLSSKIENEIIKNQYILGGMTNNVKTKETGRINSRHEPYQPMILNDFKEQKIKSTSSDIHLREKKDNLIAKQVSKLTFDSSDNTHIRQSVSHATIESSKSACGSSSSKLL